MRGSHGPKTVVPESVPKREHTGAKWGNAVALMNSLGVNSFSLKSAFRSQPPSSTSIRAGNRPPIVFTNAAGGVETRN